MLRPIVGFFVVLCLMVSVAHSAPRGKEGGGREGGGKENNRERGNENERQKGGKPPGGNWSEGKPGGQQGPQTHGNPSNEHKEGAAAGHAAQENKKPQATGAEGAAAGAATANRNAPKTSGAEGAAAGAAAANRNDPKASGAEGAAAGAAAANRNAPKATGAEGAAAGAAVANRNSPQVSGAAGAAAGAAVVRNSFDHPDLYGRQWHGNHPNAWTAAGWAAGTAWHPTGWGAIAGFCGYAGTAISYNYGNNVTCLNGNVILNGQNIGSAEAFSQQAADLAQAGTDAEVAANGQWLPLGVFALVRNEQQHPQLIVQMAVNKDGIVRGNYTDTLTDHTLPIHGAVDKETQRLAWSVGGNTSTVMEVGLNNLTAEEAPALLHKNGKTERWLLVRLEQPAQNPQP